jgi:plastocyanin
MRKLAKQLRWKAVGLALFALMAGGAGLLTADAPPATAAVTFKAQAGGGEGGVSINLYYPRQIMVHQGDTVEWANPYEEPHTVSFGALAAGADPAEPHDAANAATFDGTKGFNSGFIVKGGKFSVTFKSLGSYTFFCAIHPGMEVDVFVLGPGATIPAQNDASSKATQDAVAAAIAVGTKQIADLKVPAPVKNADGTSNRSVVTLPGLPYQGSRVGVAVMKFFPQRLEIGVGDKVTWTADSFVPHTVTFIPPSGPPTAINPFADVIPPTVFDGSQYQNAIFGGVPAFSQKTAFSMTFTKPGTYSYVCLLHADQGMAGVIVVGPAGSGGGTGAITPPSTGDGGLMGRSSGAWMIYAGLAMLVSSFAAAACVSVKR